MVFFRLTTKDKMLFARNMAMMSRAGMNLVDILKALSKQVRSRSTQKVMAKIAQDVENGTPLHEALGAYEKAFGNFFINIVKIGEVSGSLSDNLEFLATALEKQKEIRSKAVGAMIYPIVILFATLAMAGGMIFFIFPKILPIFTSLNVELPLSTRIFIGVSTFLIDNTLLALLYFVIFIVAVFLLLRIKAVRYAWHSFLLRVPVLNKMIVDFNLVGFSRTMSLLLKSGTKIVEALNITADTMKNLAYQKELHAIAKEVGSGGTVGQHLESKKALFPAIFSQMVGVGEKTGKLSETGLYLADFYEKELDQATKTVTNLLEPLLLLFMGLLVGFMAISIITPIYNVSQNF